jgi:exonuclease III
LAHLLKIAVWNANGLCQHAQEIKFFLQTFNLDILLVSETHFTNRSCIRIPNYNICFINHPDETAHGGTAAIIRHNIKHYIRAEYRHENIQATRIAIEDNTGETTVSAIYCPPPHPSTTINMTITIDFSKHSEAASLPEETIMSKTPFGDLDSRLQKEGNYSYIKLRKIIT